jgi:four helix bundle protein
MNATAKMTPETVADRLLEFAARIGKVVDSLADTRMGRHIAGQLLRSGTSPAPNYEEACSAESKRDFVHKLSICLKELRETKCWLKLIVKARLLSQQRMSPILDECHQLSNIIAKSIVTAKSRR